MPIGLYIHVPFCRTRCHFCAFYLQIHRSDRAAAFLASLVEEMRLHAERDSLSGQRLSTVYFGGGTPTTLETEQLIHALGMAQSLFGFEDSIEVSIEAHPDTVSKEGLAALAAAGFNRISFGVQSTDQTELQKVGRRAVTDGSSAVRLARAAGFRNVNVDLIYGLPGQTVETWRSTLDETLSVDPTHVSCYALTVEEETRLAVDVSRGEYAGPDLEAQDKMEQEAIRLLDACGFIRYEISNYCRPGYACRHNRLYWSNQDYLGLGPSAQSYVDGVRFGNVESLDGYEQSLKAHRLPTEDRIELTAQQRGREAVAFGLRCIDGVEIGIVEKLVHTESPDSGWVDTLERFVRLGLLEQEVGRLRLSERGRGVADTVAEALI